jgi:tetratricopeptide (TPR) repeat protein
LGPVIGVSFGCERPLDSGTSEVSEQVSESATTRRSDQAPPVAEQNPSSRPAGEATAKLNAELSRIFELIKSRHNGPARVQLLKYLKLNPNDGHATFLFGLTYHREQKYGQATPYYQQALALAPEYHLIHHFHGWALYYLGDLAGARREFDALLHHQPEHADTIFGLGLIELDEDNIEQAQHHLQRSIDLLLKQGPRADPRDISKARARLAEVYERQDELEKAKAELVKSIELYPDQYEAIYKLYRVLVRLGETEDAQRVHTQYLEVKERVRPGTSFPE